MPNSAKIDSASELVFGLVAAVGTNLDPLVEALTRWLHDVSYTVPEPLHVIKLLDGVKGFEIKNSEVYDKEQQYHRKMDAGNAFREKVSSDSALAVLCVNNIRAYRKKEQTKGLSKKDARKIKSPESIPLHRHAYILKSLKRPEEVALLRKVYGNSFLLIAAYSSLNIRRKNLATKIAETKNLEIDQCWSFADALIERDAFEINVDHGQNVRSTFHLADAFIDVTDKAAADVAVSRLIRIVFGHQFETPGRDEVGLCHAYTSALRSADLGRQVGAAICAGDGQILALGCNEVPKPGGGLYWEGDSPDRRDFKTTHAIDDPNIERKRKIFGDLLTRLHSKGLFDRDSLLCTCGNIVKIPPVVCECKQRIKWPIALCACGKTSNARKFSCKCGEVYHYFTSDMEWVDELAALTKKSKLWDITEYGRSVHAEMAALLDAAKRGIRVAGSTLYTTTFPCHNCAKHIIAAGITRVVYIEPYPKSQVGRLYDDLIAVDMPPDSGQIRFEPFVGISPRRYVEFFKAGERRPDGKPADWESGKSDALPRISTPSNLYIPQEIWQIDDLNKQLEEKGLELVKGEMLKSNKQHLGGKDDRSKSTKRHGRTSITRRAVDARVDAALASESASVKRSQKG